MRHICALLSAALIWTLPAIASPHKKAHKASSAHLTVAVLPFTGSEAVGTALEHDSMRVVDPGPLKAALEKAGDKAFDTKTLRQILADRGVDVLVKGERNPAGIIVTAYGSDGKARFHRALPVAKSARVTAGRVASAVEPVIASWAAPAPKAAVAADDDILAPDTGKRYGHDDAEATPAPAPARHVIAAAAASDDDGERGSSRVILLAHDASSAAKDSERGGDAAPSQKAGGLSFDDDAPAPAPTHHASIDDDAPPQAAEAHHESLDDDAPAAAPEQPKQTVDDVEAEAKATPPARLRHDFAISAGLDGGLWHYGFDGGGTAQLNTGAGIYPGGSVSIDAFPLAFAGIRFLGVDADIAGAELPFNLSGGAPATFNSVQLRYGAGVKLRYTFQNGIGVGLRAGYRYTGDGADKQTVEVAGVTKEITQVPGFALRALAVGGDVFVPVLLSGHRLELDVRAEALPLAAYVEVPDNPGSTALAFGWHASAAARYDLASGLFTEVRAESTGARVSYTDKGTRHIVQGNQVFALNGGKVLNVQASGTLALGFMF